MLVLLACNTRHVRDALREVAEAVVERHPAASRIDLVCAVGFLDPCDKVLDDTLIELMENVGRDGKEYVRVQ